LIQLVVNAALRQQLLVTANLPYLAFVHHDNFVSPLNRRQPVRNDYRSTALDHAIQRIAHAKFSFGIYARGGFIQDKNFGVVR
jgi:hypothetical protein